MILDAIVEKLGSRGIFESFKDWWRVLHFIIVDWIIDDLLVDFEQVKIVIQSQHDSAILSHDIFDSSAIYAPQLWEISPGFDHLNQSLKAQFIDLHLIKLL